MTSLRTMRRNRLRHGVNGAIALCIFLLGACTTFAHLTSQTPSRSAAQHFTQGNPAAPWAAEPRRPRGSFGRRAAAPPRRVEAVPLRRPAPAAVMATSLAAAASTVASPSAARLYFIGIAWYLMHFVVGISNDGLMKYLGGTLPPFQIVLLRFTAAAAVLMPVMLVQGTEAFKTARLWMHAVRGVLLALGIGLWCLGLSIMPFASCVVVNNTMPFFKMLFAKVILGERVGKERWLASIGGFIGCLIVFNPTVATFRPQSLVLLLSAMCFAMLDILNKKYSVSESIVSMLFYGSVATSIVALPRALQTWVAVSPMQYGLFGLLGVGANLLLFCLLRAFRYVDASATCPYRYTEFVLSAVAGFFIFGEKPMASTLLGSCIILPSVVYCAMVETGAIGDSGAEEKPASEEKADEA